MFRRLLMLGAAILTLAAGLPAASSPAAGWGEPVRLLAAPDPMAIGPNPAMLAAMQRDLKLTAEGALERLGREQTAHEVEARVRRVAGAEFAGVWLDKNSTVLQAGVTQRRLMARVRAAGGTPVLARYRLSSLQAASDRLKAVAFPSQRLSSWRIDIPANRLVVVHLPGGRAEAERFVAAGRVDAAMVRYESTPQHAKGAADVFAGRAYTTPSGGRCTLGFAVRPRFDVFNTMGFVTVGHCGPPLSRVGDDGGGPLGLIVESTFSGSPGEPDQAWIRADSGITAPGFVFGYSRGLIPVLGSQPAIHNQTICRSGSTNFFDCGRLTGTGIEAFVTFTAGATSRRVGGMSSTDVCMSEGDSGGPVITPAGQAQGVLIGFFPDRRDCSANPAGNSYFQPINPILNAFQLDLIMPPQPSPPLSRLRVTFIRCQQRPIDPDIFVAPVVDCAAAWEGGQVPARAGWRVDRLAHHPDPPGVDPAARRTTFSFVCQETGQGTVTVTVDEPGGQVDARSTEVFCQLPIPPW
jgi:streptogrisin C